MMQEQSRIQCPDMRHPNHQIWCLNTTLSPITGKHNKQICQLLSFLNV